MTSIMVLDGVTSFLRLKDVTITCKGMRRSRKNWREFISAMAEILRMCFRRLLCVRIEIDQLQCVNC